MNSYRLYTNVYVGLVALTLASVGLFHLKMGRVPAITVGLGIAAFKACLIAWYFMHLKSERSLIRGIAWVGLAAVVILAIGLLPDLAWRFQ